MTLAPWQTPFATYSILVDPPTEEPLTLAEAKLRAGLSWKSPALPEVEPRDQLMRDHIAAARSQVEHDTGLALLTQVRDVSFLTLPGGMVALPGQALPLQEVLEVEARRPPPFPLGGYFTSPSLMWDTFGGVAAGTARVKVGWIDAADLRLKAPLLLQAVGLLTAHLATAGRDLAGTPQLNLVPLGYEAAISPYRLIWIP